MAENYLGTANATANAVVLGKRKEGVAASNYNVDIQLTLNGEN